MRTTAGSFLAVTLAAVLAVTACSAGPSATPETTSAAAAPSEAAPQPVPSETATPEASAASIPTECEPLPLDGTPLDGSSLGDCLQAVVAEQGSGTLTLSGDEIAGTVSYRYDPDFEFRGDLETGAGPLSISFVDGAMLVDEGDGPVAADLDSADPAERSAGSTGELYRVFADPGFMGELISEGATWEVSADPEPVELPDGSSVEATRIVSAEPYTWYDIPVESYAIWVTDDWMPVAAESTTDVLGRTATVTQTLSGLGDPVEVEPLS